MLYALFPPNQKVIVSLCWQRFFKNLNRGEKKGKQKEKTLCQARKKVGTHGCSGSRTPSTHIQIRYCVTTVEQKKQKKKNTWNKHERGPRNPPVSNRFAVSFFFFLSCSVLFSLGAAYFARFNATSSAMWHGADVEALCYIHVTCRKARGIESWLVGTLVWTVCAVAWCWLTDCNVPSCKRNLYGGKR